MTDGRRWLLAPFGAAIVALGLVLPTVMPGVGFWDTAEFQTVGPVLGTAHPTGFPSYVILGWLASIGLAPFGDPAFRMNLLSALLVAAAAGLTVVLVRQLTGSAILGVAAGLGLATTPIAWKIATHADAHALHLALLALLFVTLVGWEARRRAGAAGADRWLVAAALVFGVAAANHSLTLLLPPAILVFVLVVEPRLWRRWRLLARCALVLAAVLALLYLELPLRAGPFRAPLVYGHPETWDGFRYVVLAEQFRGSLVDPLGNLGGKLASLVDLVATQFGALAPLIAAGFAATVVRAPRYALLSGLAFVVTVFFAASYANADIERYYLGPALIAWTWLAILAATIAEQVGRLVAEPAEAPAGASVEHGPTRLHPVAALLLAALLLAPTAASLAERRADADRHADVAGREWLDAAVATLDPDAVVISWWSYSTTLWYGQHVEGRLPGVLIADDRTRLDLDLGDINVVIDRFLGSRPVYLIRSSQGEIDRFAQAYRLEATPLANLWRVSGPIGASR